MIGSLGLPELLVILALVLIVFGAGKLPEVMQSMGQGVREFRKASEGDFDDDDSESPPEPAAAEPAAAEPKPAPEAAKAAGAEPAEADSK